MTRIFSGMFLMFSAASVKDTESLAVMITMALIGAGICLYGVWSCNKDPSLF